MTIDKKISLRCVKNCAVCSVRVIESETSISGETGRVRKDSARSARTEVYVTRAYEGAELCASGSS